MLCQVREDRCKRSRTVIVFPWNVQNAENCGENRGVVARAWRVRSGCRASMQVRCSSAVLLLMKPGELCAVHVT